MKPILCLNFLTLVLAATITTSMRKRSTGEYVVFVEENDKAKSLIYHWQP